jgi:2-aminoadipate transaminase
VDHEPFDHLLAASARAQQASSIREICKLATRPEVRSLAGGWPGRETFPVAIVRDLLVEILDQRGAEALQYGTTEGLPALRQALAEWARTEEGIRPCTPDHLMLVHGAQQGTDLACRILIEPGDVALVGLPTYFGGTGSLAAVGARILGIPEDGDGMDTEHASRELIRLRREGKRVKLVYAIPNFGNPTGVCLSLERRRRLLDLAVENDFLIVEDDPYGDLRFDGEKLPTLKALEESAGAEGRVIHVHSLSKTFAPGLRLAWVCADPSLVRKLVVAKQYVDTCTNSLTQHLLLEFLRRGLLKQQIAANIKYYRAKRDAMLAALERHFPVSVTWNRPEGGLFVFLHLPPGTDADALAFEALAENVAFVSGSQFFVDGSGKSTFRLSFSQSDVPTIEAAVKGIGRLLTRHLGT